MVDPGSIATTLYTLLATAAPLVARGVLASFGKEAGAAAFNALKDRLVGTHNAQSLALLETAKDNDAYKAAIVGDLDKPEIADDREVLDLAQQLRTALEALPPEVQRQYAVDIGTLKVAGNMLLERIGEAGFKAGTVETEGDFTLRDAGGPSPGKT